MIKRIMQISEGVIHLDKLPNSSDHTKADPIIVKLLTHLLFEPTLFVASKFCLNKQLLLCFFV